MPSEEQSSYISIGMVLFPNLTQLDLTAPYEVFSRIPNAKIYLLSPTFDPVRSERGLTIIPDTILDISENSQSTAVTSFKA